MPDDRRLTVVYGLPRGGTSAVACVLHRTGVDMGRVEGRVKTYPDGTSYPTYEDAGYLPFIHRHCGGRTVRQLEPGDLPALAKYVNGRLRKAWPAGVKMPGMHLWSRVPGWVTLPVATVRVVRPFEDSVASSIRKAGERNFRANAQEMMESMERFERQRKPDAVVHYYDLLDDTDGVVRRLIQDLIRAHAVPEDFLSSDRVDAAVRAISEYTASG